MQVQSGIPKLLALLLAILLAIDGISCSTLNAICDVEVNSNIDSSLKDKVTGTVTFTQTTGGNTTIDVSLTGFDTSDANTKHGFHIHEFDDLTRGCNSLGGHYNPKGNDHGGPTDSIRHYGDLGNIDESSKGTVEKTLTDHLVTLSGDFSVIGRSVVVHEKEDDLGKGGNEGSRTTGNAGKRLSCCIIKTNSSNMSSPALFIILLSLMLSAFLRSA